MKQNKPKYKVLAANKSARHDYFIEETLEAGLVLTGTEIKSLRQGKVSLGESFARIDAGELFIFGMNIKPYDHGNIYNVDPLRPRKLLVHKREIRHLLSETKREGLTIVPLKIYLNEKGRAKMEIALAKGKKLYDKRETLAKRDAERKIQRTKLK
ncbi:MAG: SsrA-binding protein SmpB [Clostridiales Family XIII bacterium]|jgi:SsrA-binding protein|nr:SsrA-binding protein SmpB [Clostridiales Family XIII bacterium]